MPEILSVGGLTADQRRLCMRTLDHMLITCAIHNIWRLLLFLIKSSTLHEKHSSGKNSMSQRKSTPSTCSTTANNKVV